MTMKQGSGTAELREQQQGFPVRWIVLFTGSKATEDYQPYSSTGEDPALVREVTDMCLTFHPHSDIRLFPQDRDAFLFWKAKAASGEWIITRISLAPNPEGVRTALEYCSLILSTDELALLRFNPFRTRDLNLHDLAREQFLNKNWKPVLFEMPKGRSASANAANGSASPEAGGSPKISSDNVSSTENVRSLEEFCASHFEGPPPTFATWWGSGGKSPAPDYFDIVLRAVPPKVLTLREATDVAAVLSGQVKAALPTPQAGDTVAMEMSRSLTAGVDMVLSGVTSAASGLNTAETVEQFQGHLADAARIAGQVASDLQVLRRRMEASLSPAENTRLADLAACYEDFSSELTKVRHPNPFALRSDNGKASAAGSAASLFTRGKGAPTFSSGISAAQNNNNSSSVGTGGAKPGAYNPAFIVAPIVIGVIALAAWKFSAGSGNEAGKPNASHPAATPVAVASAIVRQKATPAAPAVVARPTGDPALALLQKQQNAVTSLAKKKAETEAHSAAKEANGALSDAAIQKITLKSIEDSYKRQLSPAEFDKAFAAAKDWNYGRFKQALTALVLTVHESAVVGASEGKAEWKVQQAATLAAKHEASSASEANADKEAASRRAAAAREQEQQDRIASRERAAEQDRIAARERAAEQDRIAAARQQERKKAAASNPPKPKTKPAGSGAGSAAETGL